MASALVTRSIETTAAGTDITMTFELIFAGADVPNGSDLSVVAVTFAASDSLAQMKNKLSAAVAAEATRCGYSVATSAMILPSYTRG